MYAIRSKKTNRWFRGVDPSVGKGSSHHILLDEEIPTLFKTKESARIELLSDSLSMKNFDIIEVSLIVNESTLSLS
ncbi:hypothetical protein [[Eubacterium] hominis]|uniref:hypothetical protein n=1 Tax=[Eubacterium] hominis TaxID=2764325 RepID=UPI003A4E41C7